MSVFESVCLLLCGVGVFLTGMKLMGDGLGKGSAKSIRTLFSKINNRPFALYGLGVGTTAVVQSSAATTVMSMGLAGTGIMTVRQACYFVLGARLGTTVTGILVSLSGIGITPVLMTFSLVGICLILFVGKEIWKAIGYILTGFGILFAGMNMMTEAITEQARIGAFFVELFHSLDFPLLLILVGAAFTALIQSSSATTGILITLLSSNALEVSQGIFLLIGATVGTCITSVLASFGSDIRGKRIAAFNVLSSVIGAVLIGGIVWIFQGGVVSLLSFIRLPQWQLSLFGVGYSLLASLVCLPLVPVLERLTEKVFVSKEKEEAFSCFFIEENALKTPAVALLQVKKEVENLACLAQDNLRAGLHVFLTQNTDTVKRVEKEEERIDFLTKKIGEYLVSLAGKNLMPADERLLGSLHHVVNDIERIGDHATGFMKAGKKMKEENVVFSEEACEELRLMAERVYALYGYALETFRTRKTQYLGEVDKTEREVDGMKKALIDSHVKRLQAGNCTIQTGVYFYDAVASLERIGDHLENIAYSIRSITGSVS